ncbi:hypothetical protein NDU88_007335 [Pleurodeles waltl]|uniref:Uncharacterized protein n=1 Tax=Pleurodeles waltl TaxID=8319 RepID=A0AAV7NX29_PLEWA|nr:hypothetical protein NDU88_007335 [Pleurodeles waltl]
MAPIQVWWGPAWGEQGCPRCIGGEQLIKEGTVAIKAESDSDAVECFFSLSDGSEWSEEGLNSGDDSGDNSRDSVLSDSCGTPDGSIPSTTRKVTGKGKRQRKAGADLKSEYSAAMAQLVEEGSIYSQGLANQQPLILEAIYQCVMAHREETRADSRRARVAVKKLQGTIHQVAKTCTTITERMSNLQSRAISLEMDVAVTRGQTEAHEAQLIDIQWKLEDFET